jgi:hypothetical protein
MKRCYLDLCFVVVMLTDMNDEYNIPARDLCELQNGFKGKENQRFLKTDNSFKLLDLLPSCSFLLSDN